MSFVRRRFMQRLDRVEEATRRRAAITQVPPELAAWLSSLSDAQLDAVEQLAAMLRDDAPEHASVEAIRRELLAEVGRHVSVDEMSDKEAVEEWRRLCREPKA
jgi:hypothetical protein